MAVSVDLDIVGIKDALAELNKIDKVARREITRDFRKITQSVVDDARARVPLNAPISGFKRNWTTKSGAQILPWDLNDNDDIRSGVSGKRPKMFGGYLQNVATFFIKYKGPTSILFDMGGSGPVPTVRGSNMVAGLSRRYGNPSRVLWPAYEQNKEQVEDEVRKLVDKVMDYVNQGLAGTKARRAEREALKQAA
jgi:hypothetical protein